MITDEELERKIDELLGNRTNDWHWSITHTKYATDPAAMFELEESIPENIRWIYSECLMKIVNGGSEPSDHIYSLWALLHATPRQRAEAYCKMMEAGNE